MTEYWTVAAAIGGLVAAFLILRIGKRNAKEDAMIEEKPRKMWYKLGCRECGAPTPHAQITDGLCPECYAPAEAAADIPMEVTPAMLKAGAEAGPNPETVFRAMLRAMPLEQKRVLLGNLVFTAPEAAAA